ncbi:MAG: FdtA/QdtA family cupin domain-containing protein [Paludibacter sp.]|nr:FdtA/QdtA family cupin domain-containing protein [Paludibacter sp.]
MNSENNKSKLASVFDCSVIYFPKIQFESGSITPLHGETDIPFKINRIFYLYDIPGGEERGAHAHKECHQLLVAASGAFDILLDDGKSKRMVTVNRPYMGLHIPPGIWAAEMGFSSGAICLVLASHNFDESDYIREYKQFISHKKL